MDKVYVCYSECYADNFVPMVIGIASTEEKTIELINEHAKLHYADREECPCNNCKENKPDCYDKCDKEHRMEEEWHKRDDYDAYFYHYIQVYEGEYEDLVRHYYKPFELDKLQEEGS